MNRMFEILILVISLAALFAALWIVVPAPHSFLWLVAVAVSEWSLWIVFPAASIVSYELYQLLTRRGGTLSWISFMAASAALIISLYPTVSILAVANSNSVSLSLTRYFAGVNTRLASGKMPSPSSHVFADIDGQALSLDVYRPTEVNANNGASVIVVHGGSWSGGRRSDFPQWNHRLAEMGFTVFDIDYRLAPQPNYRSATADVKCTVGWVRQHAAEFDISTERVALMGRSAGGHLALLAAYSANDERLASSCHETGSAQQVRAVVSIYSPVELLWAYDNPANEMVINGPQTLANFLGGNPHVSHEIRERFILASPTSHVTAATPPTLIIHGAHDQLVRSENAQFLDQKLSKANVPHQSLLIPYAQHGFDYNINGWGSQVMEKMLLDFLAANTKEG